MLKSRLNTELGEKLMTSLAHHWEQQGVEKGIAQGVQIGKTEGIQIGKNEGKAEGEYNKWFCRIWWTIASK